MIITLLLIALGWFLALIIIPLTFISNIFVSVPVMNQLIEYFMTALSYFSGVINLTALMQVVIFYLSVLEALIFYKILFWIIAKIPMIGRTFADNPYSTNKSPNSYSSSNYKPLPKKLWPFKKTREDEINARLDIARYEKSNASKYAALRKRFSNSFSWRHK